MEGAICLGVLAKPPQTKGLWSEQTEPGRSVSRQKPALETV